MIHREGYDPGDKPGPEYAEICQGCYEDCDFCDPIAKEKEAGE